MASESELPKIGRDFINQRKKQVLITSIINTKMASESELSKIGREGFEIIEKYFVKRVGKPISPQKPPRKNFPAQPINRYVYHPQESLVVYQHAAAEANVISGHDAATLAGDNDLRRNPMRAAY